MDTGSVLADDGVLTVFGVGLGLGVVNRFPSDLGLRGDENALSCAELTLLGVLIKPGCCMSRLREPTLSRADQGDGATGSDNDRFHQMAPGAKLRGKLPTGRSIAWVRQNQRSRFPLDAQACLCSRLQSMLSRAL
jgi:hypothetical protein